MNSLEQFQNLSSQIKWPSRKDEAWKYLSLKSLQEENFEPPSGSERPRLADLGSYLLPEYSHLVIWNGEFVQALSSAGLNVMPFEEALANKMWLGFSMELENTWQALGLKYEFFDEYILALRKNGFCLDVPSDTHLNQPVQILIGQDSAHFFSEEIWVNVGQRSKVDLLVTHVGQGKSLAMGRLKLRVQDSASVELIRSQQLPLEAIDFFRTQVFLEKNASLKTLSFQKGASLARHNVDVILKGEGAMAEVNGLYLTSGEQVCDHHTRIDHVVGNCVSRQLYKGILDGHSRAVFDGQVMIRKGAQKASSEQLNKNLLLSSTAEIDSKPQLEIGADDVKATHGSAMGQMADEELFYLRSRGIAPDEAKTMLARAYVEEIVDAIGSPILQKTLRNMVQS